MQILAAIAERAEAENLPFLVIGGNAVNVHGYDRRTMDLDLMVREEDRRAWDTMIVTLGFRQHQIAKVFHMYNSVAGGLPPVDLMLVDAGTFAKIYAEPYRCVLEDVEIAVPALPHLIALKLHALRYGGEHRHTRDFGDVVELIRRNAVNLATPEYQAILSRYADQATRDKLAREVPGAFGSESPGV